MTFFYDCMTLKKTKLLVLFTVSGWETTMDTDENQTLDRVFYGIMLHDMAFEYDMIFCMVIEPKRKEMCMEL